MNFLFSAILLAVLGVAFGTSPLQPKDTKDKIVNLLPSTPAKKGWVTMAIGKKESGFVKDLKARAVNSFPKNDLLTTTLKSVVSLKFEGVPGGTMFELIANVQRGPVCKPGKMCSKMATQISTQKFLFFQNAEKKISVIQSVANGDPTSDFVQLDGAQDTVQSAISYAVKNAAGMRHCAAVMYAASQAVPGVGDLYEIQAQVDSRPIASNPESRIQAGSCNVRQFLVLAVPTEVGIIDGDGQSKCPPGAMCKESIAPSYLRGGLQVSPIVSSPVGGGPISDTPMFRIISSSVNRAQKCSMPLPCDANPVPTPSCYGEKPYRCPVSTMTSVCQNGIWTCVSTTTDPVNDPPLHPYDPLPPSCAGVKPARCPAPLTNVCQNGMWTCVSPTTGPVVEPVDGPVSDPAPPAPFPAPAPASSNLMCNTGMTGRGIWISPMPAPGPASDYACVSYCKVCTAGEPGTCSKPGMVGCCQAGTAQSVFGSMSRQMLMTSRFTAAMKLMQCNTDNCNSVSSGPSC